jgi:hypothetical protein
VHLVGIKRSDWPNENSALVFLRRSVRKLFMHWAENFRNTLIVWGDIYFAVLYAQGMRTCSQIWNF